MPSYVRKLPGAASHLIDPQTKPQNMGLYNPSYSHPTLYIRATKHDAKGESNSVLLHDVTTQKTQNIESPAEFLKPNVNLFQGIEDLRICWYEKRLWFSATSTHASMEMNNELLIGYFDAALTKVERMSTVDIGAPLPIKNVCPFVYADKLHLFDAYKQRIYRLDSDVGEDGTWKRFTASTVLQLAPAPGVSTERYRGSTSPVHLHGTTYGCVVHDIIFNDNTRLVTRLAYLHHWMEFDIESGTITFVSTPFWVANFGIEYVSGLYYQKGDNHKMTLYVGINDQQAVSFTTTLHDLRIGK